jgi:hypothetical protein
VVTKSATLEGRLEVDPYQSYYHTKTYLTPR